MVAPGCTKRLPLSGSTRPAAILSSVDLPEPLRPIKQTRSSADTDSSTPAKSGVPPKVSRISFNWISGGAMAFVSILVRDGRGGPLALDAADGLIERGQKRRTVARREGSGAARHFAGGTQIRHQVTNCKRHPDRCFRKRLAVRRNDFGAGLDAAAGQRDVGGDNDIALARALCDPVIGGVHSGAGSDALDQRILRYPDELAGDHADGNAMAGGHAIDFVLDRAGIGVDVDAGGV